MNLEDLSDAELKELLATTRSPAPTGVAEDVAKSAGVGVGKGAIGLAGLPMDAADLLAKGSDAAGRYISSKLGFEPGPERNWTPTPYGSADIQKKVEGVTGDFYKPQTTAGKYAQTVGEFAPAALAGPGGITRRLLSQALAPGVASEAAGQYTEGTSAEPYARFGGAVAGSLGPAAMSRAINPLRPSAERTAAGNVLRQEGIPVTAGQETGSPLLRALESPFGGNQERQLEDLTGALMRRTGEAGGRASRENVDNMFTRLGTEFDRLAANNTLQFDQQFLQDIGQAVGQYRMLVPAAMEAPVVNQAVQAAVQAVRQGGMPGAQYQGWRELFGRLERGAGDPQVSNAIREVREAFDEAMERSIAQFNPADLGAWREVRNQYRNALVIERAATSGGENVAQGLLTPGKVSQAVTSVQGQRNRARGQGDFSEIADAADTVMRPLPNSGTPVRAAAAAIPTMVGSGLGALAGSPGGPAGSGLGMMAGAALGHALMAGAIRNPASQAYLAGRIPGQAAMLNPSSTAARDALIQALMRSPELQQSLQGGGRQ